MNATSTLRPRASSPFSVLGPSAKHWPIFTLSPRCTIGFWFMQVPAFERMNLRSGYTKIPFSGSLFTEVVSERNASSLTGRTPSLVTTIISPVDAATTPFDSEVTTERESDAAFASSPVPTSGASETRSGTPWRCMLDPMSARFASSCSRNGMSPAATETSCFGETSI